jgi:Zn-dependent protease
LFLKLFQFLNPLLISYMISINLVIAVFNLFPVPPLDGSKVMAWNPIAWLAAIVIGAMLIFLLPVIDLLLTAAIIIVSAIVIFLTMQVFVPKPV